MKFYVTYAHRIKLFQIPWKFVQIRSSMDLHESLSISQVPRNFNSETYCMDFSGIPLNFRSSVGVRGSLINLIF